MSDKQQREKRVEGYVAELVIMSQEYAKWRGLKPDEMVEGAARFATDIAAMLKESIEDARLDAVIGDPKGSA